MKLQHVLALVITILVVIVILQNTEEVTTKLLFVEVTMPRAFLLAGALVIGCITGSLMRTAKCWRRKRP